MPVQEMPRSAGRAVQRVTRSAVTSGGEGGGPARNAGGAGGRVPQYATEVLRFCNAFYVVRLNPRWLGGLL